MSDDNPRVFITAENLQRFIAQLGGAKVHVDADCIKRAKELMRCETCRWWDRDKGPWESGRCNEPCVSEEFAGGDFHPLARFGCHYWEPKP